MGFDFLRRGGTKKPEATRPGEAAAVVGGTPASESGQGLRLYTMGPSQETRYATELLAGKGLEFDTVDVTTDPGLQGWVRSKTGSPEYPQVFLGNRPIGDFATLRRLDLEGNLDRLLAGQSIVVHAEAEAPVEGDAHAMVQARLRRGDVLSLTTPDGETFDVWAEVYANPPTLYWRGEPLPIAALPDTVGEIVHLLADPQTTAAWSAGR